MLSSGVRAVVGKMIGGHRGVNCRALKGGRWKDLDRERPVDKQVAPFNPPGCRLNSQDRQTCRLTPPHLPSGSRSRMIMAIPASTQRRMWRVVRCGTADADADARDDLRHPGRRVRRGRLRRRPTDSRPRRSNSSRRRSGRSSPSLACTVTARRSSRRSCGSTRARQRIEGGASGPALVPGNPDESLLIQAVRQTHEEIKMPPKEKLPDERSRPCQAG